MTRGVQSSKGTLVASMSVLSGNNLCEASISKYHQRMIGRVIEVKPGDSHQLGVFSFTATKLFTATRI